MRGELSEWNRLVWRCDHTNPLLARLDYIVWSFHYGAVVPGVGVRAWCVAHNGIGMETEYVSYSPPRVAAVRMTRGPWVLGAFAGSWRFAEVAPGRTRVVFRYNLRARPWWLSWLLTPMLAWIFARDTRRRLAALKVAVESGRLRMQGEDGTKPDAVP